MSLVYTFVECGFILKLPDKERQHKKRRRKKMTTFTKKRGFFTVSAALLIIVAMLGITWCNNDISNENNVDDFTPPPGKGAVRLNFNDKIARTILPGDTLTALNQFDSFTFKFAANGSGTSIDIENIVFSELTNPIILDPDTYDLTVIGYIDVSATSTPDLKEMAKNATAVSVLIEAGKVKSEKVVIRLINEPDGIAEGTFVYTLDDTYIEPDDITTATLTITAITANGSTLAPINIKAGFTGTPQTPITLFTGIYYVNFYLKVGGDEVTFRYVVHIYEGKTSNYVFTIGLNYFNAIYQFDSEDIIFEKDSSPSIVYGINSAPVTTSYTSGVSISLTRGNKITFTVKNATDYTANSFEWYCIGNTELVTDDYCTISSDKKTCALVTAPAIHPAINPYASARDYYLTVVGSIDGTKYATVVEFSVSP